MHPSTLNQLGSGRRWTLTTCFVMLVCLVVWGHQYFPSNFANIPSWVNLQDTGRGPQDRTGGREGSSSDFQKQAQSPMKDTNTIPNIVHLVHLVGPHPSAPVDFSFRQFVAIYSAHLYLRPDKIYVHTNVNEQTVAESLENTTNPYAQAVIKIPNVEFSYHAAPDKTPKGLTIEKLPNQSDFVRTDVLEKYGGIYLDDDAYILRDLSSLRRFGYQNIVGKQKYGAVCPAVMLSTPHNKMMSTYHTLQPEVFDGSWARHAVDLLTTLVREFSVTPQQVMVMDQETFFPLSWEKEDIKEIYQVHNETGALETNNHSVENTIDFIEHFELEPPKTWRRDWRLSYILHGWTVGIQQNYNAEEKKELLGGSEDISLDYVLAQDSNFARAVYPAVKDALDKGFLDPVK